MLQASLEVYHAMAKAVSPTEMARVLLLLEKLLGRGGLLRATWAQHWQASWQRAASFCVDWKHALLLAAALQVRPAAVPLSCHNPSRGVLSASIPAADSTPAGCALCFFWQSFHVSQYVNWKHTLLLTGALQVRLWAPASDRNALAPPWFCAPASELSPHVSTRPPPHHGQCIAPRALRDASKCRRCECSQH